MNVSTEESDLHKLKQEDDKNILVTAQRWASTGVLGSSADRAAKAALKIFRLDK